MTWTVGHGRERFARFCAKAHLSDGETVAKMGHPGVVDRLETWATRPRGVVTKSETEATRPLLGISSSKSRVAMRQDNTEELTVHYIGPALEAGRIDVFVLSDSLRGLGRLTSRVSYLLSGPTFEHRLELDSAFRPGSVVIPVHLASQLINSTENMLSSRGAQALAALMGLLGWGLVPATQSLYKLFKRKQGRAITDEDNLQKLLNGVENLERLLLIKIYNDQEVQAAIRAALRPLRVQGITEFQTRRRGIVIDSVTSRDLSTADAAENAMIQEVDEKLLNIEKVALVPHLAWHLSDENGPFDAKIHDVDLWARIAKGERFGLGDRMRVELRTTFSRDSMGRLNIERVIPKVFDVEHASPKQREFPF